MLSGGFGFLSRLHGLSIDNLVEVEMVLADGRVVVVSENEYPGQFFYSTEFSSLTIRRPLVGCPWRRNMLGNCYSLQSKSISCTCRLRREPRLVSRF
jgi:hypothetical protein